jgi:hypothetical protein
MAVTTTTHVVSVAVTHDADLKEQYVLDAPLGRLERFNDDGPFLLAGTWAYIEDFAAYDH